MCEKMYELKFFLCNCSLGNLDSIMRNPPTSEYIAQMGIINAVAHNNLEIANYLYRRLTDWKLCVNNIIFRLSIAKIEIEPETYRWVFHRIRSLKTINAYSLDYIRKHDMVMKIFLDERLSHAVRQRRHSIIKRNYNKVLVEMKNNLYFKSRYYYSMYKS